jgi:hypothetical protein
MDALEMYQTCRSGTKHFVAVYLEAVTQAVHWLATTDFGAAFDWNQREELLRNIRQSYGGSALLLSGGASLGMYHFGVVKLLHQEALLPRVLSGSSIGSFVAALVTIRAACCVLLLSFLVRWRCGRIWSCRDCCSR